MIYPADEILEGEAIYRITKPDGSAITSFEDLANCKINLITGIVQEGTPLNKQTLLNIFDFAPKTTAINNDTITETDGTVTKTTTLDNGNVTEILSTSGSNKRYVKSSTWVDGQLVETVIEETVNE